MSLARRPSAGRAGSTWRDAIDLTGGDEPTGSSWANLIDLTPGVEPTTRAARKRPSKARLRIPAAMPAVPASSYPLSSSGRKRRAADSSSLPPEEQRLGRLRSHPSGSFYAVYERALSQTFHVLGRTRGGTAECPEETFELAGSTGNVYTVHIGPEPTCNCPHALKGNQCKHVLYVLTTVLQAPFCMVYQAALQSSELRAIFAAATEAQDPGGRKPVESECPICFCALDARRPESIVWCRAACGQNMHHKCFATWARTRAGHTTCPMCRTRWQGDSDTDAAVTSVQMDRAADNEGYVNVADQLGISTVRDSDGFVSRRRRNRRTLDPARPTRTRRSRAGRSGWEVEQGPERSSRDPCATVATDQWSLGASDEDQPPD